MEARDPKSITRRCDCLRFEEPSSARPLDRSNWSRKWRDPPVQSLDAGGCLGSPSGGAQPRRRRDRWHRDSGASLCGWRERGSPKEGLGRSRGTTNSPSHQRIGLPRAGSTLEVTTTTTHLASSAVNRRPRIIASPKLRRRVRPDRRP
jgi:hypothetical protein